MLDSRSKKLVSLLFAVVILLSCVVVYQFVEPQEVKGEEHQTLGLSVSPFGSTFKLGVNQSKTFTAQALNGSAPFCFSWKIVPSAPLTLQVNGETLQLTEKIVVDDGSLTVCFPEASEDFVTVTLSGIDVNGLVGEADAFIVADPYTSSGYYFDGSQAVYSYKVSSDGLGWYRVYGSNGAALTAYDGTNSTLVTDALLGDMTSGALFLDEVAFDLDLLSSIPEDVRVICLYEDEYWEYINDADSSGSPYTVSVGSGVNVGYYLAADSEGRICFTSSNQTALQDTVLGATTSGEIRLNEVAFDLALMNNIPNGVRVVCSYQDEYYEYINSLDTSGSPYTVEVGAGLNNGYYLGVDSGNRICWTSTNALTTINNVVTNTVNGDIYFLKGTYNLGSGASNLISVTGKTGLHFKAEAGTILQKTDNRAWYINNCQDLTIEGFTFNFTTHEGANALYFNGTNSNIKILTNVFDIVDTGSIVSAADMIYFEDSANQKTNGLTISGNTIKNSDLDAMSLHGVTNVWVKENNILSFGTNASEAHGILVGDAGGVTTPSDVHIFLNNIQGSGTSGLKIGIGCHDYTTRIYVTENSINRTSVGVGMWENVKDCEITGNVIDGQQTGNVANAIGIALVGVSSGSYGTNNLVSHNIVRNTGSHGLLLQYIDDTEVSENQFDKTYDNAISNAYVTNNRYLSNSIQNATGYGLQLWQATSCRVSENNIRYSSSVAIYLNTANWNKIISNEATYNTGQGIFVTGASNGNILQLNQCLNNTDTGISLWNGDSAVLTNNYVQFNTLLGNGGGAYYDGGTGTIANDNNGVTP